MAKVRLQVPRFVLTLGITAALAAAPFVFAYSLKTASEDSPLAQIWKILFNPGNPLGGDINSLIFGLTVIGLLGLIAALIQVTWNDYFLDVAIARFDHLQPAKANALPLDAMLERLGLHHWGRHTFIASRIDNLYRLKTRRTVDVGVLKDITGDRVSLWGGFARFIAGSLTVLGLIGTVLGLALAVGELAPLVGKVEKLRDIAAFTGQMLKTLAAMQTAFSCTLAGLMCAFVLSVAAFVVTRAQLNLHARLEDFSNHELVPALMPRAADHAMAQFSEKLIDVGDVLTESFKRVDNATEQYVKGASAVKEISETMVSVSGKMDSIAARSIESHDRTKTNLEKAAVAFSTASGLFDTVKSTVEASLGVQRTVSEQFGQIKAAVAEIGAFPEKLQHALDTGLTTAVEHVDKRNAAAADGLMGQAKTFFGSLAKDFEQREENYALLLRGVHSSVEKMLEGPFDQRQGQIVEQLKILNSNLSDQSVRAQQDLKVAVDKLYDALSARQDRSTRWGFSRGFSEPENPSHPPNREAGPPSL